MKRIVYSFRKMSLYWIGVLFFLLGSIQLTFAQEPDPEEVEQGIGIRFSTDLNSFQRPEELGLVPAWFSTGKVGVFWKQHKFKSGYEIGLNLNYKQGDDKGFPNLPVVMRDFQDGQQTGLTSLEMDLKVGPRFYGFHPKIGYVLGYRFEADGYQLVETLEINKWYLNLPFGASYTLPTNFGSVGFGAYYFIGVTNVLKNPNPDATTGLFNGGRMRAVNFEILVSFDQK